MFAELIDGADVLVWKSVRRLFNNPAQAMTLSNGIITLQQPQFPITLFPVFVSERVSVCVCLCDWERECSVCVCVCVVYLIFCYNSGVYKHNIISWLYHSPSMVAIE